MDQSKNISTTLPGSETTSSENQESQKFELKNKTKDYFRVGAVGHYFLRIFGKKDPSKPKSFNLSMMHGINRISIIMFLIALLYLIGKRLF